MKTKEKHQDALKKKYNPASAKQGPNVIQTKCGIPDSKAPNIVGDISEINRACTKALESRGLSTHSSCYIPVIPWNQ